MPGCLREGAASALLLQEHYTRPQLFTLPQTHSKGETRNSTANEIYIMFRNWLDSEPVPGTTHDDSDGHDSDVGYNVIHSETEHAQDLQSHLPTSSNGVGTSNVSQEAMVYKAGTSDRTENSSRFDGAKSVPNLYDTASRFTDEIMLTA